MSEREARRVVRRLFVVTHPEATHVVERLVGGWYDSDLTARGVAQAQRIADVLAARVPSDRQVGLFSSDLCRARRTAESISARLGVPLALDAGLREQSYGAAEGLPPGTLPSEPPPADGDRLRHHDGVDGSETRLEVATRVFAAIDRVLFGSAECSVVVTHGGAATYVIAAWIGMPLESVGSVRFTVSPGSISLLTEDDASHDRRVVSLNETGHLG